MTTDAKIYALTGHYLAEPHLAGKSQVVEIESYEVHEFEKGKGKEKRTIKKPVLFFKGKSIPLGLTARCNLETVIDIHGRNMDEWKGKSIKLVPTTCISFGKSNTPCIRIERA